MVDNLILIFSLVLIISGCKEDTRKIQIVGLKEFNKDSLMFYKNIKSDSIKYLEDMSLIPSDDIICLKDSLDNLFHRLTSNDKKLRTSKVQKDVYNILSNDSTNQVKLYNVKRNCPNIELYADEFFLVVQHSYKECMSYYYHTLKLSVRKGYLKKSSFALLEDRLLMLNGFKQKYGSQIRSGQIYEIENMQIVDSLRYANDLMPLNDYKNFMNVN